jgi:hypothetical protein
LALLNAPSQVLHSVTTAALRALPQDAVQEMDKALQLNSINVSKWQASMIVIQGGHLQRKRAISFKLSSLSLSVPQFSAS